MAVVLILADGAVFSPPTAAELEAALRAARLGGNDRDRGSWVGPRARVTRGWNPFSRGRVSVAWLYGWPTGGPWSERPPLGQLSRELAGNVARALEGVGGSWTVTALKYEPTRHGAVAWWASGDAARTDTRDAVGVLPDGDSAAPGENPVGPGQARGGVRLGEAHTATTAEILGEALDTAETLAQGTAEDIRDAGRAVGDSGFGPWLLSAGTLAVLAGLLWTFAPAARVVSETWAVERRYRRDRG